MSRLAIDNNATSQFVSAPTAARWRSPLSILHLISKTNDTVVKYLCLFITVDRGQVLAGAFGVLSSGRFTAHLGCDATAIGSGVAPRDGLTGGGRGCDNWMALRSPRGRQGCLPMRGRGQ